MRMVKRFGLALGLATLLAASVSADVPSFNCPNGAGGFCVGTGGASSVLSIVTGGLERMSVSGAGAITFPNGTVTLPGATFSGVILAPNGAVGAPSYSFSADATTGMWSAGAGSVRFSTAGSEVFRLNTATPAVYMNSFCIDITNGDTCLFRQAAGVVDQRNGVNAQGYSIYNTFTSATNFERLDFAWSANTAFIQTNAGGGGGSNRVLNVRTVGAAQLLLGTNSTTRVTIDGSTGVATFAAGVIGQGSIQASPSSGFILTGNAAYQAPSAKLNQLADASGTTGYELNDGTPTLGTCTGGTLVSGAHNFGGRITGTTGGTCAVNFGTPNFTNAPFCFAIDETAGGIVNTSGESASTFNITNITSGHNVKFHCDGRIGT